jgi:MFS family permease
VLGYSALKTGVAYLPLSLTIVGASTLASRFVDRFTPKPVLAAGLLVSTAGFVLLMRVSGHGDYASQVLPAMLVLGTGLGMSFVPITISATNGVAARDSELASGLVNTTQQVGGSLGTALLNTIFTTAVTGYLTTHGASPLGQAEAAIHGYNVAFTASAVLLGVAAVLVILFIRRTPADANSTSDQEQVPVLVH